MFTLAACECNDVQPEGAKRGKSNLCVLAINLFSQCQAMSLRAQRHAPVLAEITPTHLPQNRRSDFGGGAGGGLPEIAPPAALAQQDVKPAMPLRAQQHTPVLTEIPSLIIDKTQEIL
jgi:hypothetical protein